MIGITLAMVSGMKFNALIQPCTFDEMITREAEAAQAARRANPAMVVLQLTEAEHARYEAARREAEAEALMIDESRLRAKLSREAEAARASASQAKPSVFGRIKTFFTR